MHIPARMVVALLALGAAVAEAQPFAYSSDEGSGTVSVIDTATDRVTATITTGGKPRGIAASHDGKRLYVSDQTANGLAVDRCGDARRREARAARQFARRHLSVGRRPLALRGDRGKQPGR